MGAAIFIFCLLCGTVSFAVAFAGLGKAAFEDDHVSLAQAADFVFRLLGALSFYALASQTLETPL